MVTFCAKATVAASRSANGVRLRKNLSTKKILHNSFFRLAQFQDDARCEIHQMDVLSGRGERANTLEPTINSPQLARKNNKYMAWLPMASVPQFLEKTQTYLAGHLISKGAYNAPLRLFWRATSLMVREYPDRPLVGVGAVIVEHDRVLLIKRGKAPLLGEWSIPGGLLELGETIRQGAEREALEETGLGVW